jgi:dsRNA-specific ribonuclease
MNSSPREKHSTKPDDSKEEVVIFYGKRGKEFKLLIESLLKRGNLLPKYIDTLLADKNLAEYDKAFTAMSANAKENYEVYELLGDISANKFIVWYFARRFPFLLKPEGVKVIARLRINYGARASFQSIAKSLGFWDFITASEEDRGRNMKKLLEDTFEAFLGVTEYLLDENFRPGVGNAIVYDILHSIFDRLKISLEYNDLFDAKTRLKELCDMFKNELKDLNYKYVKNPQTGIVTSTVVINSREIATGTASIKQDAEQNAAKEAILIMNNRGFKKDIPIIYSTFPKY